VDEPKHPIPSDVYRPIGSHPEPIVIALRQPIDLSGVGELVAPADQSSSSNFEQWRTDVLSGDSVAFSDDEEQIARGFAMALRAMGIEANVLEGGVAFRVITPIKKGQSKCVS
jgi:hypothetical protein